MLFRRIVLSALLIGALSGLLLSGVQRWQVIPIIETAEVYERARAPSTAEPIREAAQAHADHSHAGHSHDAGAWEPAAGSERLAYTVLSNVLGAAGFALALLAAMAAASKYGTGRAARLDWRYGLLWGLAGYTVFFLAPTLGLPPEIPGAAAAAFESRQLWWTVTVLGSAVGLTLVVFGRSPWRWAGLVFLAAPHVVGAPHLATGPFADYPLGAAERMSALARDFVWATAIANAVFWLALGAMSGWTVKRYVRTALA